MNQKQTKLSKLRTLLIVLGVVIMPVIFRLLNSLDLDSIRNIDFAMIFGLGFVTAAFLLTLRDYLKLKNS